MKEYTVYALQNKRNKKIYVDMTTNIEKPIILKNLILKDIVDGDARKSDFVIYILGQGLRYGLAYDLKIRSIIKFESYKNEFGYNDLNMKLKFKIMPPVVYGEPNIRRVWDEQILY